MTDMIGSRICGGNTAYKRNESDFYPTPPEATQALLDFLNIPNGNTVWEPACGEGHMVEVMEKNGLSVIGTDIQTGTDFLTAELPSKEVSWIITNPPFSLAEQFIRKANEHNVAFAMLLKSQYWNAAKRVSLFSQIQPSYILPLTWRPDFLFKTRGKGSPLMDVNWCVWFPLSRMLGETHYIPLRKPIRKG